MRLDFNVLWVDDQPHRVAAQIKAIAGRMEEDGFHFSPTLCDSVEVVDNHLSTDVFTDEIDLVLVDWDLGGGVRGQQVISNIREHIRYKDVVFYSAQTELGTLRDAAFDAGLEGVFCASRNELVDEVIGVFESLVKKVLDLDHSRGIVMGATSDIDHIISECLIIMHKHLDAAEQGAMVKDVLDRVEKRLSDFAKRLDGLRGSCTMDDLFAAHEVFTANDRLRVLSRMLKMEAFKAHEGARPSIVEYMNEAVPHRNILGHQILVPEGRPKAIVDSKGNSIDLEKTRELRRLILKLRQDFRDLFAALQAGS
jgi:hypothetical protein